MFRFLTPSRPFCPFPFLNPGGDLARRVKVRPGMDRFVAFLRREGFVAGEGAPRLTPGETRALLPGRGILAIVHDMNAEDEGTEQVRAHFDGRAVMHLTGWRGPGTADGAPESGRH